VDEKSGFVLNEPTDAEEIVRLIRLGMDQEKAISMGRAARELALGFSVGANADQTETIYREVMSEKSRERNHISAIAEQG
jgi:hypothetical protein